MILGLWTLFAYFVHHLLCCLLDVIGVISAKHFYLTLIFLQKSHAERAELVLQLRHVQRRFERLLANHPEKGGAELDREELIEIRLACDFVASVKPADRGLTDQVASRFLLTNELDLLELCPVCGLGIPFERRDEGQCPASHQALRCRATFRTCFEDTRSCRWCGSHYHPHSGKFA